jgi:hypothetical protein
MSWNHPEELTQQVILEMSLDQHAQLTKEEEDQDNILMIWGIGVFLPLSQEEVEICVAGAATIEEQSAETIKEELEQVFETTQVEADKGENENSEELLITLSQEVERVVALELTKKEAEGEDEHSEEWLNIFNQEDEETATWEFAEEEGQEADNICFVDLWQ